MNQEIDWKQIYILVLISFVISFIFFLLTEIIWGDVLKTLLSKSYKIHLYSNINLILIIGLGFIFEVSIVTNILIFKEYTAKSKVKVNFFTFIFTFIILYAIASLSVIIIFSRQYAGLSVLQKMSISWLFFSYFSIYILSSPFWFWMLALFIYHVILIIMMRFLLVQEIKTDFSKSKKYNKNVDKYSLLGK